MPLRGAPVAPGAERGRTQAQISQERLRKGAELLAAEWNAIRARQEFALQIERELTEGAGLEPGELTFDTELKLVRRIAAHAQAAL